MQRPWMRCASESCWELHGGLSSGLHCWEVGVTEKREETEVPTWIERMASASSRAHDTTLILSRRAICARSSSNTLATTQEDRALNAVDSVRLF